MNFCKNVSKSRQLKAILATLSDGELHSTRELSRAAECYCTGTRISELRHAGYRIPPAICIGKVYHYRWNIKTDRNKGERKR